MPAPFPHMTPGDVPLFAAFVLSEQGRLYKAWAFDLHLGQGVPTPGFPQQPGFFDLGRYLTQLRVDAIGWIGDEPTIFEVKPHARLTALGQMVAYCQYWTAEHGTDCHKAVITSDANDMTLDFFARNGITVYIVEPALDFQVRQAQQIVYSLPQRTS